ncbi:hypothetical protein GCM10009719_31960 [Nocardioides kribbensis]
MISPSALPEEPEPPQAERARALAANAAARETFFMVLDQPFVPGAQCAFLLGEQWPESVRSAERSV